MGWHHCERAGVSPGRGPCHHLRAAEDDEARAEHARRVLRARPRRLRRARLVPRHERRVEVDGVAERCAVGNAACEAKRSGIQGIGLTPTKQASRRSLNELPVARSCATKTVPPFDSAGAPDTNILSRTKAATCPDRASGCSPATSSFSQRFSVASRGGVVSWAREH